MNFVFQKTHVGDKKKHKLAAHARSYPFIDFLSKSFPQVCKAQVQTLNAGIFASEGGG